MKIRSGFVSNSSSSSYVVGHIPEGIACVELKDEQRKLVLDFLAADAEAFYTYDKERIKQRIYKLKNSEHIYLTQFIYDIGENRLDADDAVPYIEGEMSQNPRDEDLVYEISGNGHEDNGVWILRDHAPYRKHLDLKGLTELIKKELNCEEYDILVHDGVVEVRNGII